MSLRIGSRVIVDDPQWELKAMQPASTSSVCPSYFIHTAALAR